MVFWAVDAPAGLGFGGAAACEGPAIARLCVKIWSVKREIRHSHVLLCLIYVSVHRG